jgi:hypothetical protein
LFSVFVFAVVGISELSFWRSISWLPPQAAAVHVEEFVQKANRPGLLVVVSDPLTYVQLAHYLSIPWKQQFVYLQPSDQEDKGIRALRKYMPLEVRDPSEFVGSHREFLLYVEEPGFGFDWFGPEYFIREAASLKVLAIEGNRKLYLVTLKPEGP